MKLIQFFIVVLLSIAPLALAANNKVIFCYWGTWSHYRPGNGQFRAENIDPQLCTHIGYAFFGITDNSEIRILDSWLDNDLKNIERTIALKKKNPNLKIMAAVGGWNEGSAKYSNMAANAGKRAAFVNSVVNFLIRYGFDGLDLDWEYPAQRGGAAADRSNFVTLLAELKAALKVHNLLLTVAVAAGSASASISYDIANFAKHVDLINVMTYDFAGSWDKTVGFNAPLEGPGANTVKAAISYWLEKGAPSSKLVLGLPAYGRSFTLANQNLNAPGAASSGAGAPGPFTQEAGYLGFNEICDKLKAGWTTVFDYTHKVPYAYQGNQWVGFDNQQSIAMKVDYLKSMGLAGAMVWSIETDDFNGHCGVKFPLLTAIKNSLLGVGSTSTTSSTSSQVSVSSTSSPKTNNGNCQNSADGMFVVPSDCSRFYRCVQRVRYDFQCPSGLYFDQTISVCNWPWAVNCRI